MIFSEQEIRKIVSKNRNYDKISSYIHAIESIHINTYPMRDSFLLKGHVESYGFPTEVELQWNSLGQVTYYNCECYYCTTDSACSHVGAVMRVVNQLNPQIFPFTWKVNRQQMYEERMREYRMRSRLNASEMFLENQKKRIGDLYKPEAAHIHLECLVEEIYADGITLRFKIGETRMYFIKNIEEFVKDVASESHHVYGKDFATSHTLSLFDDASLQMLKLIQACVFLSNDYSNSKNEIVVNRKTIDQFFDLFSNNNQIDSLHFQSVDLKEHPMDLTVTTDQHYVQVELENDPSFIVGKNGLYTFQRIDYKTSQCIRYETHQNQNVGKLYMQLRADPLVFTHEDFPNFDRYIFNVVDPYFQLGPHNLTHIMRDNRIELFGDINDEGYAVFNIRAYHDSSLLNSSLTMVESSSINFEHCLNILNEYKGILSLNHSSIAFDLEQKSTTTLLEVGLEHIKRFATVYVSESLKRISTHRSSPVTFGITFTNNLLGIDFEHETIPKDEIKDVLQAYKRKKKFYRLKNGEMVALLDDDFEAAQDILEKTGNSLDDLDEGSVHVQPYRVFMLDALASHHHIETPSPFKKHLDDLQIVNQTTFHVPDTIQATLRPYQVEGYRWLKMLERYGFGGILADDMGLGKTLQMICYFASSQSDHPHLVVCPSSVLLNWEQEIHRFAPHLKACILHGTKKERDALIESMDAYDIAVTSYDYLRRDIDTLKERQFETVVLDEAQYIKNASSKNSKSVKALKANHRFALTGTPIENSLAELWSIFDFLMPHYLYKYPYFKQHYESPIVKESDESISNQLKHMVQPFILRRLKTEVLSDLPDKTEVDMLIEFSEEERKLYYANLAQVNEELQVLANIEQSSDVQILALLTRLRRICCEPRTVYENIKHRSSKLEAVVSFIQDLKEDGKQVLLFSSFTSVLDLIAEALDELNLTYHHLDGRVSKVERQARIKAFQRGEGDVFLISLRAGGTGINLTSAEVVIHFDPWWNISAQNQATDRAYRFGQTKNVLVYRFIMKDSIEEKIQLLQARKKQLSDTFVEESEGSVVTMTKSEIMSLFTMD